MSVGKAIMLGIIVGIIVGMIVVITVGVYISLGDLHSCRWPIFKHSFP